MNISLRTLLLLAASFSLSTGVLAQTPAQPDSSSMSTVPGDKNATHKKPRVHSTKKVNPKSAKADADSVSTGAPGDTAKGGQ